MPVTEVAAAREDVTHVVHVCAFAMPACMSMLDVSVDSRANGGILPKTGQEHHAG